MHVVIGMLYLDKEVCVEFICEELKSLRIGISFLALEDGEKRLFFVE